MPQIIRIATRKSPLAVWQAEFVSERLQALHPGLSCELVKMTTKGDQILNSPLSKIGGKGLFVKELETALYEKRADLAVHSMKDVPMELPQGLALGAILAREDPYDAFVSNQYASLDTLPASAIVGTSSLRRAAQLKTHYPSLVIKDLRGNVNTRLAKLDAGEFDAVILASAGLKRLGFADRIRTTITDDICLPAVGQGALGIECREDDDSTLALIKTLNDNHSASCVKAERAMNLRLNGGCQVPIGGYAILQENELWLRGLVANPDGSQLLQSDIRGPATDAENLGTEVANRLLAQGADKILRAIYA